MNRILVLGTGAAQADLISACKERNMEVFACSYISGDHGECIADCFKQINIVDYEAVLEFAKNANVDYVYSVGSDIAMPTAMRVSEALGLKHFCSADTAKICNTKNLLRDTLGEDFEGNIRHQIVRSKDDELNVAFPAMMKPTDSQGQRGVYRVESREEFLDRYDASMSFSREKTIILEEFVDGEELSVNTFSNNGKLIFFVPSERITWNEYTGGIIHRHIISDKYDKDLVLKRRIRTLVEQTLSKLDIVDGPAYFQIIVNKVTNMPKLIEVTPRLDGCHMWRLIKYATGIDLLGMTIDALLGRMTDKEIKFNAIPYETEFLCAPPETIFREDAYNTSGCDFVQWYYKDGNKVRRMNGYMEKCGYCIRRL